MPRLKGADVQFIIRIPQDGHDVLQGGKIKTRKHPPAYLVDRLQPILYHPAGSFPSRSHRTKHSFSFSSPHLIFHLSPTCLFLPRTEPVYFSPCAYSPRVSSLYLSSTRPPPSHQQLSLLYNPCTFQPITNRAVQTACVPSVAHNDNALARIRHTGIPRYIQLPGPSWGFRACKEFISF